LLGGTGSAAGLEVEPKKKYLNPKPMTTMRVISCRSSIDIPNKIFIKAQLIIIDII
jgi:hypothetical protein